MNKYNFSRKNDDTLNVRMPKRTADKIREIANNEAVSVQEVCRKFLEVALNDYLVECDINKRKNKSDDIDDSPQYAYEL